VSLSQHLCNIADLEIRSREAVQLTDRDILSKRRDGLLYRWDLIRVTDLAHIERV
jgi:hypothetical protein